MPIIRVVGGDDEPEDFGEVDQSVVRRRNPYHPSQLEVTVATGVAINLISAGGIKHASWTVGRLKPKTKKTKKKLRKHPTVRR